MSRGGARNNGRRLSRYLTEADCRKLYDADARATAAGLPFNYFLTLSFGMAQIALADNAKAAGAFIKRVADWLRPYGHPLAWAWVQEASIANGGHVHVVLHIPPELEALFSRMPCRWAKVMLADSYVKQLVETQGIRDRHSMATDPALARAAVRRKLDYMLKAVPHDLGVELGLKRHGEACSVIGKRLAVWQRRKPK